ncbi:MAG: hypothetical protein A2W93_02590 [Bacteroidetes bacterium GWF2_43_63]|nr:MAG: hypothetical protein A2W94_08600 [Bacteroidetes bacterium GWE2_42_42]OFY53557.1 MAG: hypothetical protein A2W93_02590 [Bacteroidetes bacterium GWF2_43_63]HBG71112.1 hypothetical protein [Bacteroidales bacterium]HCB63689.1 hypothetical protein [Bacteroidales bacterium]HCY24438.1 hypothetical protein [Bacteroidales bacterium]
MLLMKNLLLFSLLFLTLSVSAQVTDKETDLRKLNNDSTEGWKKGGMFTVAFSQVSLSNWAAGGENSFSGNSLVNTFANYKKAKISWDNTLELGYGIMKQGDQDMRKTDDKIDFSSKFGRKLTTNSFAAALLNFKTQFMPGYNYPDDSTIISNFMAPGYLLFAAGYDFKRGDWLSLFIAPVTGKMTIVTDELLANAGAFGVEPAVLNPVDSSIATPGKKMRSEFGGYFKGAFSKDVMKNVKLNTKLELFTNYLHNPLNIDVYWETNIGMKVNKFITVTIGTTLIYDDDIDIEIRNEAGDVIGKGPRTQFKEVFGLGFSYKF